MAKNVGKFAIYLDLEIDTKTAVQKLKNLENTLRRSFENAVNSGARQSKNSGDKLVSELAGGIEKGIPRVSGAGSAVGLSFGQAVFAGIAAILTSEAVLGLLNRVFTTAKQFIQEAFTAGMETERQGIGFKVILGDIEKAKKLFSELNEAAIRTPFVISELREIAKNLLGYGFAAEEVVSITKMLGDVAAGTGGDLKLLAKAYGQVRTFGKVYAQELNQFAEQGVALRELLAKERGITVSELVRGMETGKINISFEEFDKVFRKLYESKFMGLMAQQATTLSGRLQTLSEMFSILGQEIIGIDTLTGQVRSGSIFDLITKSLSVLVEFLVKNSDKIRDYLQGLVTTIISAFSDLGEYKEEFKLLLKLGLIVFAEGLKQTVKFVATFLKELVAVFSAFMRVARAVGEVLKQIFPNFQLNAKEVTKLAFAFSFLNPFVIGFLTLLKVLKMFFESLSFGILKLQEFVIFLQTQAIPKILLLKEVLVSIFQLAVILWQNLFASLVSFFQIKLAFLSQIFTNLVNSFKTYVINPLSFLIASLFGFLSATLDNIRKLFFTFFQAKEWSDLWFQFGERFKSAFWSVLEVLKKGILDLWNSFWRQLTENVNKLGQLPNFANLAKPILSKLPKFAGGGSFVVGGQPGIDKNLVAFWATRGERVIIQPNHSINQTDNRQYHNTTIVYTTQARQFMPLFLQLK